MADHGWNADGAGGGKPAGNNGSDDGTGARHAANPNVVPFPRDWIGPLEELVPIHLDDPDDDGPDASSFWDGDSTAVHEVVGAQPPRGGSWEPQLDAREARHESGTARGRSGTTSARRHRDPGSGVPQWQAPRRRRGRGSLIAGALILILVVAAVLVWVVSGRGAAVSPSTVRTTRAHGTETANAAAARRAEAAVRRAEAAKRARVAQARLAKRAAAQKRAAAARRARVASDRAAAARRAALQAQRAESRNASLPAVVTQSVTLPTPGSTPANVDHVVQTPTQTNTVQQVMTTPAAPSHAAPGCTMSPDSGCLP